jgi:AcrR family transcriptional regulator
VTKKGATKTARGPTKGSETRQLVVALALQIAAREGLSALSIGRLAKELRMSKSGLFLHFGSKEKLESAVLELARLQLFSHILKPIEAAGLQGIERVWALCDFWMDFSEHGPLRGGYFFTGAFFRSAKINGPIPRQIRRVVRDWMDLLVEALKQARRSDEIRPSVDTEEAAFDLNSILIGAQWALLMTGRDYTKARSAILSHLRSLATDEIPDRAFESVKTWKAYLKNRRVPADR